jgi:PAS domain S-box-containing protein
MSPVALPLRFIPRRSPPFPVALAISLCAMFAAVGISGMFIGWPNAFSLSPTYFPAFIVATLFAGQRWGWVTLAAALAIGLGAREALPQQFAEQADIVLYAISGAVTVVVAGRLREIVLRLDEAQAALDRSEARLQLAQDAGEVGLWDWDVLTGEGYWSPTLYKNLGLAPGGDSNIRTLLSSVHPDDQEWVRQSNISAIRTGKMAPTEYRVVRPDGEIRWLLSRGEMLQNGTGRIVRATGVNIDITERRLAFEKVRESDARFRALADSAPVLLWVSRSDGHREFVNQAYVDFLGVSYEEALTFEWRHRIHANDLPHALKEQVAGEASRALFTLEARYQRADGSWRWIRSVSQPRTGPNGEFAGFVGIGIDISDAKQAELDLLRINDLLAERVQAALAERDEAQARLHHAQKLEAVGQLTGGVAHDFNNLLTVVIGALDLIQRRPDDTERRGKMIEAALGAARRGERLTHQLLAFSRRQALKPEAIRIDELLGESEPLLRRAVGEAVSLAFVPDAPAAVVMVDPGQFDAAIMNLVVNARDAVGERGEVRLETSICSLVDGQIPDIAPGDYVQVVVRDDGVGMDPDILARVFEPFFTTKDVGKGTGLGLSQVYGFARQSGGGVQIETAPGQGAAVCLYLPRVEALAEAGELAAEQVTAKARALQVLLVEDDAEVAVMVAAMLEELGHHVVRADGVQRAMEMLKRPDLIDLMLTDLVMPGGRSGVDLARAASELRPGLPIILSSGYTGETLSAAADAPWPLLRKPYSAELLARTIARTVDPETQPA